MKFGNKMLKPECYWLRLHCGQQSDSVTWTTITCLVTLGQIAMQSKTNNYGK